MRSLTASRATLLSLRTSTSNESGSPAPTVVGPFTVMTTFSFEIWLPPPKKIKAATPRETTKNPPVAISIFFIAFGLIRCRSGTVSPRCSGMSSFQSDDTCVSAGFETGVVPSCTFWGCVSARAYKLFWILSSLSKENLRFSGLAIWKDYSTG